jgi:hypothetical protein
VHEGTAFRIPNRANSNCGLPRLHQDPILVKPWPRGSTIARPPSATKRSSGSPSFSIGSPMTGSFAGAITTTPIVRVISWHLAPTAGCWFWRSRAVRCASWLPQASGKDPSGIILSTSWRQSGTPFSECWNPLPTAVVFPTSPRHSPCRIFDSDRPRTTKESTDRSCTISQIWRTSRKCGTSDCSPTANVEIASKHAQCSSMLWVRRSRRRR